MSDETKGCIESDYDKTRAQLNTTSTQPDSPRLQVSKSPKRELRTLRGDGDLSGAPGLGGQRSQGSAGNSELTESTGVVASTANPKLGILGRPDTAVHLQAADLLANDSKVSRNEKSGRPDES